MKPWTSSRFSRKHSQCTLIDYFYFKRQWNVLCKYQSKILKIYWNSLQKQVNHHSSDTHDEMNSPLDSYLLSFIIKISPWACRPTRKLIFLGSKWLWHSELSRRSMHPTDFVEEVFARMTQHIRPLSYASAYTWNAVKSNPLSTA